MEIAALIKQARRDANVTQKELGRRVGRSRESISQLEAGVRTPSFGSLQEILAALGMQARMELEPLDADVRARRGGRAPRPRRERRAAVTGPAAARDRYHGP